MNIYIINGTEDADIVFTESKLLTTDDGQIVYDGTYLSAYGFILSFISYTVKEKNVEIALL